MWVYQYQPLLNGLLQKALVELCTQSLPWEGRLEIDGIFCVSGKDPSQQIVIKIHKALEKPESKNLPKQKRPPSGKGPTKKVHIEAGKIVSSGPTSQQDKNRPAKSSLMPLNLSLPNLKSGASVTQHGISPNVITSVAGLPKTMSVSNQSLRALLGNKPGLEGAVAAYSGQSGEDRGMTILKQPQPTWLKQRDLEGDSCSEDGSENRKFVMNVKEEPQDHESESSLDLDEETLPATNVTCKICSIDFDTFRLLQAHTLEMHKRHACRQCCNTFSLRCNLRRHERLHAGVKPHACSYCKKSFSRSADLKAHLRKHAAEKTPDWISCSKCPKSFRSAVNLRLHMYKVHKEKDCVYACSICEKVFHDADEFQIHRESHTESLVHAGRLGGDSTCSTPVLNGSQDSMDGMSSDNECASDNGVSYRDIDSVSQLAGRSEDFDDQLLEARADFRPRQLQTLADGQLDGASPGSGSPYNSTQGNEDEELGLYFGSPLVIREENDSNDADSMKKNRRKSKPSKVVSAGPTEVDDDTENLEPHNNGKADLSEPGALFAAIKREVEDDAEDEHPEAKRARIQSEGLISLAENFGMADQSLEAIMKQVNENLYRNKDVLIAEEKEKEIEKKGKSKTIKGKTSKQIFKAPTTSTPNVKHIEPKPPIVLLVSTDQSGGIVTPKIAIPSTPTNLKMSLVKQDASASWSVSPKNRPKRDGNTSFSPIPQDMFAQASKDADTKDYTCAQWGCVFTVNGFQAFEDHTLMSHGRYPCKFCSQTFTGRNNRTRHIRYHMTGKQHQCADCGKFFARPDSLKEHRFIHTKSYRDSNCCNCKIYFEKKATLLSHMKKCFSDEQLLTDKLSPEEIEREIQLKKEPRDPSHFNKSKDSGSTPQATPSWPRVASDVGVMKAEYLQKEKQKIMDVKHYLDSQMAAMETVLDAAAVPPKIKQEPEDDVTVIDLDAKARAATMAVMGAATKEVSTPESETAPQGYVGYASSLMSNMAMAVVNTESASTSEKDAETDTQGALKELASGVLEESSNPKPTDIGQSEEYLEAQDLQQEGSNPSGELSPPELSPEVSALPEESQASEESAVPEVSPDAPGEVIDEEQLDAGPLEMDIE